MVICNDTNYAGTLGNNQVSFGMTLMSQVGKEIFKCHLE